jgi:hypothetical protein
MTWQFNLEPTVGGLSGSLALLSMSPNLQGTCFPGTSAVETQEMTAKLRSKTLNRQWGVLYHSVTAILSVTAELGFSQSIPATDSPPAGLLDQQDAVSYHSRFLFILALARRERLAIVPRLRPFISAIWLTV